MTTEQTAFFEMLATKCAHYHALGAAIAAQVHQVGDTTKCASVIKPISDIVKARVLERAQTEDDLRSMCAGLRKPA